MTLVRWDPFRVLSDNNPGFARNGGAYGAWIPAVDIFERGQDLVLRAELPGMSREDIDVNVENGLLTVQGERRREQGFDEDSAHRVERAFGKFTRSFKLPTTVDASKIAASYRDGVLEIVLPKSEASKPKKVQIQAA